MSEKRRVAMYCRVGNKSQLMTEEEQKKMIKESTFLSDGEQGRKNEQFEKMIGDIKDNKVVAVTLLEREISSEQEMEQLKQIAAKAEIPLHICK